MSSNDDFLGGMKSDADRDKEWTDAAEFFVKLRREPEQEVLPEPDHTKEASAAETAKLIGRTAWNAAKGLDPTRILSTASGSRAGAAATLGAAALFGGGAALLNRGKKSLGGQSGLENSLQESKAARDASPEPKSFTGKTTRNFQDLFAGLATSARKHPVKSSVFSALGGATAAAKIFSALKGKAK